MGDEGGRTHFFLASVISPLTSCPREGEAYHNGARGHVSDVVWCADRGRVRRGRGGECINGIRGRVAGERLKLAGTLFLAHV